MKCSIDITEKQINKIFLNILPMTERDEKLYKGNNALVLRPEELKEINSLLKVGDCIAEEIFVIVERAIYKSSIDLNSYPLPSKLRIVRNEDSTNN